MIQLYHIVAMASGSFAALSSVFGKYTFGDDFYVLLKHLNETFHWLHLKAQIEWLVWICLLTALILCNVFMWIFFSKAMAWSPNTIEVTSVNSASNFLFSSVLGVFLFKEQLSLLWMLGIVFIVIGLLVLHVSKSRDGERSYVNQKLD